MICPWQFPTAKHSLPKAFIAAVGNGFLQSGSTSSVGIISTFGEFPLPIFTFNRMSLRSFVTQKNSQGFCCESTIDFPQFFNSTMALTWPFTVRVLFRVDSRLPFKLRHMTRNEQLSGLLSFSATMRTSPEVQAKKWRFSGYRFDFEEPL